MYFIAKYLLYNTVLISNLPVNKHMVVLEFISLVFPK